MVVVGERKTNEWWKCMIILPLSFAPLYRVSERVDKRLYRVANG